MVHEATFHANELVYCGSCFLPYDLNINLTQVDLPFDAPSRTWHLTSCGHTLCSACLFPNGNDPDSATEHRCPKCERAVTVAGLSEDLPPGILPYFRDITHMSEEVLGAIKFQNNNLLVLVDYLRAKVDGMRSVVREARENLEKSKQQEATIVELQDRIAEMQRQKGERTDMPPPTMLSAEKNHVDGFVSLSPADFRREFASSRNSFRVAGQGRNLSSLQTQSREEFRIEMVEPNTNRQGNSPPIQATHGDSGGRRQYETYNTLQYPSTPRSHTQLQPLFPAARAQQQVHHPSTPRQHTFQPRPEMHLQHAHSQRQFTSPGGIPIGPSASSSNAGRRPPIGSAAVTSRNGTIPKGPSSMSSPYGRGPVSRAGNMRNELGSLVHRGHGVSPMRGGRMGGDFVGSLPAYGGRRGA